MKKLMMTLVTAGILVSTCYANEDYWVNIPHIQTYQDYDYDDDANWLTVGYYQDGQKYFNNKEFTKAIDEFRKALRVSPNGIQERASLINSYLARAGYYNGVNQNNSALDDLRSALFFIKYYTDAPMDEQMKEAAQATEQNMKMLMGQLKISAAPSNRYNIAKQLRVNGNFPAAATEFQAAATDMSLQKDSYKSLGDIANIFNMPQMALKYYGNSLKISDGDADTHLKMARALDSVGQVQAASTQYNMALAHSKDAPDMLNSLEKVWLEKIEANPNDAEAQANLGAIYQKKGDYAMALTQYKKAEALNPSNPNTRLNLGTLYQVQKKYPDAIAAYDSILQLYPQNANAHYYKAQCLKESGQKQLAIQEYKAALSINPNVGTAKSELLAMTRESMTGDELFQYLYQEVQNNPKDADAYYQLAYEFHKAKRLEDAVKYYNDAIKLDPKYADAYINLSQTYKQLLKYPEAMSTMEAAKKALPADANIAKYYTAMQKETTNFAYDEASKLFNADKYQESLKKYLSIKPETAESMIGVAACYQKLDEYKVATEYYKKAFALDPKNSEIAYYIAMLALQEGNLVDAKTYAQKSLALDAKNERANEILVSTAQEELGGELDKAIDLFEAQKYDQALAALNVLIAKDSKNSNAYYYKGLVYDAQKKYVQAIAEYERAYGLNKDLLVAKYSIAVDYDYLAKYKEANQAYRNYIALSPGENEYTDYAKKRLTELKQYD